MAENAVIVGAGQGLSASLARQIAKRGGKVVLAARSIAKLADLAKETGAELVTCDASQPVQVDALFRQAEGHFGIADLVIFNASHRARGPVAGLDVKEVERTLAVSAYAGFLVGQAAAKAMLIRGSGSIFFTGASASVKGYAESAPFAMGKFALRGLAQSMARELAPKNIHVAHFVIDGGILAPGGDARAGARGDDGMLLPEEIAKTYLQFHDQHRSAWAWEIELRPWAERF